MRKPPSQILSEVCRREKVAGDPAMFLILVSASTWELILIYRETETVNIDIDIYIYMARGGLLLSRWCGSGSGFKRKWKKKSTSIFNPSGN